MAFVWEHRVYPVIVPFVVIAAIPLGVVGEGHGVHFAMPFFTSAAQGVFPLLLVALFVELASVHERFSRVWGQALELKVEENNPSLTADSRAFEKQISIQARKMIWLTVIGESAALYALASGKATSFLGVLCVLCMAFTVYLLATAHLARIAPITRSRRH